MMDNETMSKPPRLLPTLPNKSACPKFLGRFHNLERVHESWPFHIAKNYSLKTYQVIHVLVNGVVGLEQ
jgi:hypothetical protein